MFLRVIKFPKCWIKLRWKRRSIRCFGLRCRRFPALVKILLSGTSGFLLIFLFTCWIIRIDKSDDISTVIQSFTSINNTGGKVLSRDMTSWNINNEICSGKSNETNKYVRAKLRGPQQTPIFVYGAKEDVWVSGNIIKRGMWEIDWIVKIHNILAKDNNITFIDIGANVGVFSLTAAKLGCKVIAIDPLDGNIARLCRSVEAGNLTRNIVLIHNAVSNKREKVALEVHKGNIGGTYVRKLNLTFEDRYVVNTILLDDLLEVFSPRKVVIKMDVETFEAKVLEGGRKFFIHADVICVLVEFGSHRKSKSGEYIINFLKEFQLEPEIPSNILHKYIKWSGEVLFSKISSKGHSIIYDFSNKNIIGLLVLLIGFTFCKFQVIH